MRFLVPAIALAASLLPASSAYAYDDALPAASRPEPHPTLRWYGYQTLLADGAALALAIPAVTSPWGSATQQGFGVASGITYGLGGPIVHLAHGHLDKALLDLGLRAAVPLALGFIGGLIGAAANPCDSTQLLCGLGSGAGASVGALVGVGTAVVIDSSVLAREPKWRSERHDDVEDARIGHLTAPGVAHVEPSLSLAPERIGGTRAMVGLSGAF